MSSYVWKQVRFWVPSSLVDQTVVTFVDDPRTPTFQLTLTSEGQSGSLATYVDDQQKTLTRALSGYTHQDRSEREVGGRAAIVLQHRARDPRGKAMRQVQVFIDAPPEIVMVTLTHLDKPNENAERALESLLGSMEV